MSRQGKLLKNTIILAVGTFFPKLAVFITLPILTAYMTQTEYGTYDLVITLVALVLPAATLQIQSAAFRFLIDVQSDEKEKKSIISNIYGFVIPISIIVLLFMYLLLFKQTTLIRLAICSYFLFDIMSNASKQIIRGLSKNMEYSISAFISALGQILMICLLVLGLKGGLLGGVTALATAELISMLYLLFKGKIYKYIDFREINKKRIKELLAYSWPMVPNSLSQWVMHVSDRLVISFFMGVEANAVYAVSYKIPSILSFAQTTFNMAWQENASISSQDKDVAAYYSEMFQELFNIVSGFMSILIGITPILFRILIRGDYAEAYKQIPILYMGIFFFCLSAFWGGIYVAFKKTKSVGMTTVMAALINLVIDLLLINVIGLYAASISTLVSYIALCIFRSIGVQKFVKLTYRVKHVTAVFAVLIILCVIAYQQNLPCMVANLIVGCTFGIFINRQLIVLAWKKVKRLISKF